MSFINCLSLQAILRSGQLEPRHISNLAWAFTVRKAFHPGLFDALAARVLQLGLEDFEPHHLSLLAWSFAKQGLKVEGLMQALGDQAAVKAEQLLPQVWGSAVGSCIEQGTPCRGS